MTKGKESPCAPALDASIFGLDWPWSKMADAMVRYADASRRLLEAQTAGRREATLCAQLDLDDAMSDYRRVREKIAELWLMGFRCALELNPVAITELVGRLVLPTSDVMATAIEDLETRLDRAERILLKLAGGS